ncbi:hypothetical protein SAMN02745196_02360 [Clostridium collagenovorans DSM 3089]|uniref:Transposase n=1 Tax=Clostridium collagenovorans DSM 3089 TaxID=1121306 RepID=A0A1M5XPI0_9CLOT|nr:hypothetical protein [Clostridium collagenovorans]SHI01666.1 hypothetical protein SAMN02745196_02360 [Clostridium collagenovorans DSM 3089]
MMMIRSYNKVKTMDQRKALTYFLEYLFLIQDDSLSEKFKEIKDSAGGVVKMSIDEIREKYLEEKGKEESKKEIAIKLLDILDDETIAEKTGLDLEEVKRLRKENLKI